MKPLQYILLLITIGLSVTATARAQSSQLPSFDVEDSSQLDDEDSYMRSDAGMRGVITSLLSDSRGGGGGNSSFTSKLNVVKRKTQDRGSSRRRSRAEMSMSMLMSNDSGDVMCDSADHVDLLLFELEELLQNSSSSKEMIPITDKVSPRKGVRRLQRVFQDLNLTSTTQCFQRSEEIPAQFCTRKLYYIYLINFATSHYMNGAFSRAEFQQLNATFQQGNLLLFYDQVSQLSATRAVEPPQRCPEILRPARGGDCKLTFNVDSSVSLDSMLVKLAELKKRTGNGLMTPVEIAAEVNRDYSDNPIQAECEDDEDEEDKVVVSSDGEHQQVIKFLLFF